MRNSGELPSTFKDGLNDPETARWLDYVDKQLAVLLFPNITRNMIESWEAFGYINSVPQFNSVQKLVLRISGALAMRLANGRIKKKYHIEDERVALTNTINQWTRQGLAGKKFHGGDSPDLSDVAVYGCLKSIEQFTSFAWLIGEADKALLVWFNRMEKEIPKSSCVEWI